MIEPIEPLAPAVPGVVPYPEAIVALDTFHQMASERIDASDPATTHRAIVEGAAAALHADRAVLVIADAAKRRIVDTAVGGPEAGDPPASFDEYARGPGGWAFDNDDPLSLAGRDEGRWQVAGPLMAVPLRFKGETIGSLTVRRRPGRDPFTPHDTELLVAMANQAVLAIGYARRLRSEQRQHTIAETLRRLASAVTSTLDLREVLDGVLGGLGEVLTFDAASILLNQDDTVRVVASVGMAGSEYVEKIGMRIPAGDRFGEPLTSGRPVLVGDWSSEPVRSEFVGDERVRAWMGVPLLARNQPIGMLTVGAHEAGAFTGEDLAVASAFADQAAIAIQNARLFQRTQIALAKSETLYHTAQSLIGSDSLSEVLQAVVDGAVQSIPADRVALITANISARRIVHVVRGGPGRDRVVAVDYDEFWEGLSGWVIRERTPALSPSSINDDREGPVASRRRRLTESGSVMVVPLRYRGKIFGTMTAINRPDQRDFTHRDLELLGAMASQAAMGIENARLFDELERLAVTDELTGLSNRRGFFELAKRELDRSERSGRPVTAAMLDIDGFKRINDSHGHAVGDEVLRHLADRCRLAVRDVDLVGRYGGEEFCFLLPETDIRTAEFIADRILARISGSPMQTEAGPLEIQVSMGLAASRDPQEDIATLLDRADTAMYEAKQAGGNGVRIAR